MLQIHNKVVCLTWPSDFFLKTMTILNNEAILVAAELKINTIPTASMSTKAIRLRKSLFNDDRNGNAKKY